MMSSAEPNAIQQHSATTHVGFSRSKSQQVHGDQVEQGVRTDQQRVRVVAEYLQGGDDGVGFVLVVTVALMGGATTTIGLLPTYEQIGLGAPLLRLLMRILQGFGAGAKLSVAAIVLTEYALAKKCGLVT